MHKEQSNFDEYTESFESKDMNGKKNKIKKPVKSQTYLFLVGFGATFLITLIVFVSIGFIPKEIATESTPIVGAGLSLESQSNTSLFGVDFTKGTEKIHKVSLISKDDLPVRIVIPNAGVDSKINNPESTNVDFLDSELTKGPVRYPGSGTLSSGNIFLFGHSTGLKIVQNQAYKVFNKIKDLKEDDSMLVYSQSGKSYTYKVVSVKQAKRSETWIDFSSKEPSITLSTCDRLSEATDRYVVTAILAR